MQTECLCLSVLRVAWGHGMKLVDCKSALKPLVVYTAERSKAVVPVLALTLCNFVVYTTRRFIKRLDLCFVLVF